MNLPSVDTVNAHRIAKFKERVTGALATAVLGVYRSIVEQVEAETGTTLIDIAAALATLAQGPTPLLLGTSVKPAGRAEPAATPATLTEPPGAKAPAGTPVHFGGHDFLRFRDGRFVEYWGGADDGHVMSQLGMLP